MLQGRSFDNRAPKILHTLAEGVTETHGVGSPTTLGCAVLRIDKTGFSGYDVAR